jgi:hypothetical protein
MSASIARYLKDFGAPPPPPVLSNDLDLFATDMADFEPALVEEPLDIEAERNEAHARGRDEATEELTRRWEDERTALLQAHQAELAALKAHLEGELADRLAAQIKAFAASTAREIADQTASVMAPLVEDAIVAKAVSDLALLVRDAIREGSAGTIIVRGPSGLFDRLRTHLGEDASLIRHVDAPDVDITVEIGDAALVTRMSAWFANLKKVMG